MIWFGANDAALPIRDQPVPLERYKANLSKLIWMVRSPDSPRYSPATRVVLMTPPPCNTEQWGSRQAAQSPPRPNDRDFATTRTYAEAAMEVGVKEGVAVADVWTKVFDAAGREEKELKRFLTDGLHLNTDGYKVRTNHLGLTCIALASDVVHDRLSSMSSPGLLRIIIPNTTTTTCNSCLFRMYPFVHLCFHRSLFHIRFDVICQDLPRYKEITQKRCAFLN